MFVRDESMTMVFPVEVIRFKSDFGVFVVLMVFYARKSLFHCFRECFKNEFGVLEVQMERAEMMLREQNDVFVVFLPLVKTWWSRQKVGFSI
jgi:hypothetical protein